MCFLEIIFLAFALGMDCFIISVSKGIAVRRWLSGALLMAVCFGVFQAGMPCLTYFTGILVYEHISAVLPHISCALLVAIGIHICLAGNSGEEQTAAYPVGEILTLSVATSIDALSAGVVLLKHSIGEFFADIAVIGAASLLMSLIGTATGVWVGKRINYNIQIVAGLILIALGIYQLF